MTLSTVLDVAIGLVFVYLLLGLMASALQETVANILNLRGKQLQDAIKRLLSNSSDGTESILFKAVFEHPLVGNLSKAALPSYVPARNFGLALVESLRGNGKMPMFTQVETAIAELPEGPARQALV